MKYPSEYPSKVLEQTVRKAYDDALDRAAPRALKTASWIVAERRVAPGRLAELLNLRWKERMVAVATKRRFQTYSLARYALEESERVIPYDPRFALKLVRLARTIVIRIDPRTCGGWVALADLGAYAVAWEGNVQRVCGDLRTSAWTFAQAREIKKRGGSDPDTTAHINFMESSLRRDLGQFQTALSLLDRAADGLLALGEHEHWIQAQLNRSNIFQAKKEFDRAASILEEISSATSNPCMLLYIRHNLIHLLAKSGRVLEAATLLEKSRALYRSSSAPLVTNRRLWVEGIIASGLGKDQQAADLLENAEIDLGKRGYTFDAALIRSDLLKMRSHSAGASTEAAVPPGTTGRRPRR